MVRVGEVCLNALLVALRLLRVLLGVLLCNAVLRPSPTQRLDPEIPFGRALTANGAHHGAHLRPRWHQPKAWRGVCRGYADGSSLFRLACPPVGAARWAGRGRQRKAGGGMQAHHPQCPHHPRRRGHPLHPPRPPPHPPARGALQPTLSACALARGAHSQEWRGEKAHLRDRQYYCT